MHSVVCAVLLARAFADTEAPAAPLGLYQIDTPQLTVVGEGPTRVTVESQTAIPRANGFAIRFSIDNSKGPEQDLRLSYRSNTGTGAGTISSKTVALKAGERRHVDLPTPSTATAGLVEAHSTVNQGIVSIYFNTLGPDQHALLAIGRPVEFEEFAGEPPHFSEAGEQPASARAVIVAAADAPTEPMSYSGYELVAIPDPGTFEQLSASQKSALEAYLLAGGLVVMRPANVAGALPLLNGSNETNPYGLGTVIVTEKTLSTVNIPWAQAVLNPRASAAQWATPSRARWPLLPQATPPLGAFLLIIMAFTAVIGPGSVWVARRRGAPALLLTIPAVALGTCLLIIGFSVFGEGFSVHSAVYSYTWLDTPRSRALTVGVGGYYANISPEPPALPLSTTVVTPWGDTSEKLTPGCVWGEGLTLGGEAMPARAYREWGLMTVEPTRARLIVKSVGDGLEVQNALGWPIVSLTVNVKGTLYSATGIVDGARGALHAPMYRLPRLDVPTPPPGSSRNVGGWFSTRYELDSDEPEPARFSPRVGATFDRQLEPGEFIASITGQGFFPTGGVTAVLHDGLHLVRGEVSQ